jgi:4-amino-4-deoxy-L-arabinose transferase-like glycosyltransferase
VAPSPARASRAALALAAVLALGGALRLDRLAETPAGLFADEVAIAANALAIGSTGRDLAGERLPLYSRLRSFEVAGTHGIVSQPVFQYASVPFALAFGRTPAAARLPAVAFGLLGIAGTFLLARALFGRATGLAAAGLLALSPWHLHMSRVGFEAVSLPALLAFAGWQLATSVERPRRLVAGAALAALATYAYPPAQLLVPLWLAGFAWAYGRRLLAHRRALAVAALAVAVLELPNLHVLATGANRARLGQTLITRADLAREPAVLWLAERRATSSLASAVLGDRRLLLPFVFAWGYASHLSPRFLFLEGDANPRHHPTRLGACPLFYAPLLAAGILALVRRRREPQSRWLLWWLVIWPVPASLAIEAPHAIRSIAALPALEIASALGLVALAAPRSRAAGAAAARRWRGARAAEAGWGGPAGAGRRVARATAAAVAALAVAETAAFLRFYHGEYRVRSAPAWQAGVGPALQEVARRRLDHPRALLAGSVLGIHAFALFFGDLDLARVDPTLPPAEQLEAQGYWIAAPGARLRTRPGDLWLLTHAERGLAPWRELARFPYPDGSPNLYVVEWAGPEAPPAAPPLAPAGGGKPPRGRRESSAKAPSATAIPAARAPEPGGPR